MAVWLDIDPRSGVPIFKQVIDQVRRAVATGVLKPDEQLPTVRELAEVHSVNPNTIAKAYQNLESMRLVYTRPGVRGGTFIAPGVEGGVRQLEVERFREQVRRLVRDGANMGLSPTGIAEIFQSALAEWEETHPQTVGLIADRGARKIGPEEGVN